MHGSIFQDARARAARGHNADGSYGSGECLIRYEDDEGAGVPGGECYVHNVGDRACQFQLRPAVTGAEWPEAD